MTEEIRQREDLENQVWNAIAAFEQIVETIPNARVSLEALSHAYQQVGDLSRARDYLSRLVNVVIEEQDRSAVEMLRDRMVALAASDPLARDTLSRMMIFSRLPPARSSSSIFPRSTRRSIRPARVMIRNGGARM